MCGVLLLNKPVGFTSHDCVAIVRRCYDLRKVGHAGTLDPAATGLLVLCLGKATRLLEYLTGLDKQYRGQVVLGVETDSYDTDGEIVASVDASHITAAEFAAALEPFRGTIRQVPPMASAKQVDGQRLHRLHRLGKVVPRPPVEVRIHRLEMVAYEPGEHPVASVEVDCGSGTYIRSLAHDLGRALGVGGHLRGLVRTKVGQHHLEDAVTIETIEALSPAERQELLRDSCEAVAHLARVTVSVETATTVAHGIPVEASDIIATSGTGDGPVAIFDVTGRLLAIAERHEGRLQPRKVLID